MNSEKKQKKKIILHMPKLPKLIFSIRNKILLDYAEKFF